MEAVQVQPPASRLLRDASSFNHPGVPMAYVPGCVGQFGRGSRLLPGFVVIREGDRLTGVRALVLGGSPGQAPHRPVAEAVAKAFAEACAVTAAAMDAEDEVPHARLRVGVLGGIEVDNWGQVGLGGPSQRRIFAALVEHAGDSVSLGRLVDITWPACAPPQAVRNVRTYISRLRAALGPGVADRLVTRPTGYALELAEDELDVTLFERRVAAALGQLTRGYVERAIGAADEALLLWRGRPYGEFATEDWVRAEVSRLEELRLSVAECRCEGLLSVGRETEALSDLASIIEEHPLREGPRRLQMLALYWSRRHVDALRAFQAYRDLLIDEVGLGPSDDLVALDRAIASDDPSVRQRHRLRLVGAVDEPAA